MIGAARKSYTAVAVSGDKGPPSQIHRDKLVPFDTRAEAAVQEFLSDYHTGMELEVHFRNVTGEIFADLYNQLLSHKDWKPALEYSLSVSSRDAGHTGSSVHRIYFEDGERRRDEYLRKSPIKDPPIFISSDYLPYSIHLNKEQVIPAFKSDEAAETRFRARISFTSSNPSINPWRVDMSAIKRGVFGEIGPALKTIKMQMFPRGATPSSFLDLIPRKLVDQYEIEIEYIGKDAPIVESFHIIRYMFNLIDPAYGDTLQHNNLLSNIASIIISDPNVLMGFKQHPSLKRLTAQATTLDINNYATIYPPIGWYVSEKLDGERCVVRMVGTDSITVVLGNSSINYVKNPAISVGRMGSGRLSRSPHTDAGIKNSTTKFIAIGGVDVSTTTLVDCEYMPDQKLVAVFDVLYLNGESLYQRGFALRHTYIGEAVRLLNTSIVTMVDGPQIKFVPKVFLRIESDSVKDLEHTFRTVYEAKREAPIDGIILVEPQKPYIDTTTFKWKPPESLTIDFLVKKVPPSLSGHPQYAIGDANMHTYLLFVGADMSEISALGIRPVDKFEEIFPSLPQRVRLQPIQFSPSADPFAYIYRGKEANLDGKIVEMRRDGPTWKVVRIRNDRKMILGQYYGNYIAHAEAVFNNYIAKFPLEMLYKFTPGYFAKEQADSIYKAPNAYKRFVIGGVFGEFLRNANRVVDLASGRGADLGRYFDSGVRNLLCIDRDPSAIAELTQRKFSLARRDKGIGMDKDKHHHTINTGTAVYTSIIDLTQTRPDDIIRTCAHLGFAEGTSDAVVCNFAIHYFCDVSEHIVNLLRVAYRLLKPGGVLIYSTMDGSSVHKLLSGLKKGESYTILEGPTTKYELRKEYGDNRLLNVGQMISVRLPMTTELYAEPLCNIQFVTLEAHRIGFMEELDENFNRMLSEFARGKRYLSDRLTEDDKAYISLHHYVVMRKKK